MTKDKARSEHTYKMEVIVNKWREFVPGVGNSPSGTSPPPGAPATAACAAAPYATNKNKFMEKAIICKVKIGTDKDSKYDWCKRLTGL